MDDLGYKNGNFTTTFNGKRVDRISLFPVINFITGPPGVLRNGGVWKYIKEGIIKELLIPTIMTQVLHFTDFNITKNTFNRWWNDEGKSMTLVDRIKEVNPNYEFILFADSGGFKLLYNTQYDLSHLGIKATPESIFDLQVNKYGADFIVSLDYPIPPNLVYTEAEKRMENSIDNAIKTMTYVQTSSKKVVPYLAVHGRNKKEIEKYLGKLWINLKKNNLLDESFGLAIGSLVPLKNNYDAISEVVLSVIDFLQKKGRFDENQIPIHVFGITGNILPYLALYGIDTFDSKSAVQAAVNLKFLDFDEHFVIKSKSVYKLDDWPCDCVICKKMQKKIEYNKFKKYLKEGTPYKKEPGFEIKSYYYAQVALHNILKMISLVEKVRTLLKNNELYDRLRLAATRHKSINYKKLIKRYELYIETKEVPESYDVDYYFGPLYRISMDYDINKYPYYDKPIKCSGKEILLVLQCTKRKPYRDSQLYKSIYNLLGKDKIILENVYRVTLSGLFGPVPEDYDSDSPVMTYDFMLNKYSKTQIEIVKRRLKTFIEKNKNKFKFVVAYVATRPYRDIVFSVKRELKLQNFIILPTNLKKHVSGELRKRVHLEELRTTLLSIIKEFLIK